LSGNETPLRTDSWSLVGLGALEVTYDTILLLFAGLFNFTILKLTFLKLTVGLGALRAGWVAVNGLAWGAFWV
jgi:hypothetical protein